MERQERFSRKLIAGRTCGSRRRRFLAFVYLASMLLSFVTSVAAQDIVNRTANIDTNNNGRKRSLVINSDKLEDDVIMATNLDDEDAPAKNQQQKPAAKAGCNSCKMRAEMRSLSLAQIKEHVLNKLGLKEPPNVKGRLLPPVPPAILDSYKRGVNGGGSSSESDETYGMQNDQPSSYEQTSRFQPGPKVVQEPDNYHARTDRVIAFAQPQHGRRKFPAIQLFKFADNVRKNYVKQAVLHVYIKPSSWNAEDAYSQTSVNLEILQVIKSPKRKEPNSARHAVFNNSVVFTSPQGKWYKINLTNVVDEWFRFPRNNLGIEIVGLDRKGKHAVILDRDYEDGSMIPYIEVYTEDGRRRRFKREISNNCNEDSNTTLCCRFPLTVDFEEFGWDWVIAPKRYEANYCNGDCPHVYLQANPHTHIVYLASPPNSSGPCCAPKQMSPIAMLYFDAELNIVSSALPGMVVERCGCS